ncbi:TadE/TadG family type IV pilus assembly protein [Actinophytocola sediminis]
MSTELVIAAPLLLVTLLLIVQAAMWVHATNTAKAAATQGLAATRVHTATAADGITRAREILADLGDGPLTNPRVSVVRTAERATVEVTGITAAVLPFVRIPVHSTVTGSVERFVPDLAGR